MSSKVSSVLFCCDHNSIRSPMAEGLMKKHVGTSIFVQSAGVGNDKDIEGFAVAVCEEVNIELTKHKVRSFDDLENWGDDLESYDLIIALSPLSHRVVTEHLTHAATEVEFWDIADPTGAESRNAALEKYRAVRDDLSSRITNRFPS